MLNVSGPRDLASVNEMKIMLILLSIFFQIHNGTDTSTLELYEMARNLNRRHVGVNVKWNHAVILGGNIQGYIT